MKTIFDKTIKEINKIRKEIKGMTFEQAAYHLGGYNCDGTLFDYDRGIRDFDGYLVGTVLNKNGKAYMNKDSNFYEVWQETTLGFSEQVLAMTEQEIREQIDRLK